MGCRRNPAPTSRRAPGAVRAAVALAALFVLGACSSADRSPVAAPAVSPPAGSPTAGSPTAGSTAAPPRTEPPGPGQPDPRQPDPGQPDAGQPNPRGASHPVGTVRFTVTDEARGRSLDTLVHYPARAAGVGALPLPEHFPLVLMAHGYRLPADGYERVVLALAARGYVVAAPDFPHTSSNGGDGQRSDIVNQPADLASVLDAVVARGTGGTGSGQPSLPPIRDPERVAVMGHSDGGLTAAAMAFNTNYRDPRIAAAVVLTGGRALFDGSYFAAGSPPLLAVHGTADGNPFSGSERLVAELPEGIPGYLVAIDGGAHIEPYMFDTGMPELGALVADFLDAHLGLATDEAARARLRAAAAVAPFQLRAG